MCRTKDSLDERALAIRIMIIAFAISINKKKFIPIVLAVCSLISGQIFDVHDYFDDNEDDADDDSGDND